MYEAHHTLGGRGRTAEGPYRTNDGPHALYSGGPHWTWLAQRDLIGPLAPLPPLEAARFHFRHQGALRRTPPLAMLKLLRRSAQQAPVDVDFMTWATEQAGEKGALAAAHYSAVALFHHDPGTLSAAFVQERLRRAAALPPEAHYPRGGWASVIDRMAARAWNLGVRVETLSRVDTLPTGSPVIVATSLDAARRLLQDDTLTWTGARTVLLDLAVRTRRGDPFVVSDLDAPGWLERFTAQDRTLAPAGSSSSRDSSRSRRAPPAPTASPVPNSCSTWPSTAGASASPGGARPPPTAVPARSTCRAPVGATGPRSNAATVSTSRATRSPPPVSSRRSRSTARSPRCHWHSATAGPLTSSMPEVEEWVTEPHSTAPPTRHPLPPVATWGTPCTPSVCTPSAPPRT